MGKPNVHNKGPMTKPTMSVSKTAINDRKHKRNKDNIISGNTICFPNPVNSLKPSSATISPVSVVPESLEGRKLLGKRKHLKHIDSIQKQSKERHSEKEKIGLAQSQKHSNAGVSHHLIKRKPPQAQTERYKGLVKTKENNIGHKKKKSYNKVLTGEHVKSSIAVIEPAKVQKLSHNNKRRSRLKNKLKEKKKLEKKKKLEERKAAILNASDKVDSKLVAQSRSSNRNTPQKTASGELKIDLLKGEDQFSANWKTLIANKLILPTQNKMASQYKSKHTNAYPQKHISKERQTKQRRQEIDTRSDDIWFDDVDRELLELPVKPSHASPQLSHPIDTTTGQTENTGLTKYLAMDCEMVGVGRGGVESVLARVSLVNVYGHCVYDKFVKPRESVTDYRTFVSGIRPENLKAGAETFETVQKEVDDLIQGRILVGHALSNDFQVLYISHPRKSTRDTARYKPFRKLLGARPSLKKLADKVLGVTIQTGEHNSVEDAQVAMRLYTLHRKAWERLYVRKPKR